MTTLLAPVLRYTGSSAIACLRCTQRRWARVHDVRFLVTHQQGKSIVEKYKEKLERKAKVEGYRNVNELKEVYREKIQAQRRAASTPTLSIKPASSESSQHPGQSSSPFPPRPPPPLAATISSPHPSINKPSAPPGVKTLSSYIDVEKTRELPQREIEYLWRLRHAKDPHSLCAIIPQETYTRIQSTARKHPQFILPLPREEQGAEIHFLQWTFPNPTTATVLFTHLAEFKLRGEFAQPHTTVTHHLDMQKDKGVVLLEGRVVKDKGISVEEGKWLLMCLQKFYGGEGEKEERKRLLEQFSIGDEAFKLEALLEEAEKLV